MSETEHEIAEQMAPDEDAQPDETPDETPDEDGTPDGDEPEAAAPPQRSQQEIEKLHQQLDREAIRHAKTVAKILGDDFALLVPSPVDWTPGFIFNVPEMHPSPEQIAELHALLGAAPPAEYQEAPDAEQCETCLGFGDALTGSRKPGQETKPCVNCGGTGWRTKATPLPQMPTVTYPSTPPNGGVASPETYQVKDSWGRPSGHPHFGVDPVAIGV